MISEPGTSALLHPCTTAPVTLHEHLCCTSETLHLHFFSYIYLCSTALPPSLHISSLHLHLKLLCTSTLHLCTCISQQHLHPLCTCSSICTCPTSPELMHLHPCCTSDPAHLLHLCRKARKVVIFKSDFKSMFKKVWYFLNEITFLILNL